MSTINLVLTPSAFPVTPSWTLEQFHQALAASLATSTTTSNVILGQVGGTAPTSDIGPWVTNNTWFTWQTSAYKPAIVKVGDATNQVTLSATPTATRTITLPDATGTLALTTDINRATVSPTVSATTTIDWSLSKSFAIALDKNITIANSNSLPGQDIEITIYNPAAWTVTWPASVNFPLSPGVPTQTTGGKTDRYFLRNVAGTIYARFNQNY